MGLSLLDLTLMDSYTYRTGKLFDVAYLMGGNVK